MSAKSKSPDDMLTVLEVAREYRISKERIRCLCRAGELRHLLVGVKVLIPRWVMVEWIRDNLSGHPPTPDVSSARFIPRTALNGPRGPLMVRKDDQRAS